MGCGCVGGAGAGGVRSMVETIFHAVSEFASGSPQNLTQITITVQQRGMVDNFVSIIEQAEKTVDHSLKAVWTQLKGYYLRLLAYYLILH